MSIRFHIQYVCALLQLEPATDSLSWRFVINFNEYCFHILHIQYLLQRVTVATQRCSFLQQVAVAIQKGSVLQQMAVSIQRGNTDSLVGGGGGGGG